MIRNHAGGLALTCTNGLLLGYCLLWFCWHGYLKFQRRSHLLKSFFLLLLHFAATNTTIALDVSHSRGSAVASQSRISAYSVFCMSLPAVSPEGIDFKSIHPRSPQPNKLRQIQTCPIHEKMRAVEMATAIAACHKQLQLLDT